MTHFEYKPISLEGPAFRLLRLLKGNSDDPIHCQLFESKLALPEHTTASPEHICDYAALSYTWGNTSRPCDIIVNGSNMAVTKNAYLALRDLRCQEQDQVLWVDALCINQDDNDEQGQQVQQMGSIYSQAKRVFIWLGEATYDTDYVMYYMKKLEKESFKHASNSQEFSELVNIWSVVVRDLRPDQRGLLVEGLQSLLHRSWFKRVWIKQEAANAQGAEIICGSKSISANIFALMPTLLEITPEPDWQPILDIMPGSRRNDSWWAQKRDLHTMLDKFRSSEATDPRDKIYALLGISSNACDTDLLRADYGKNLEDTIFDTTSFLLNLNELDPPTCRFFDWTLQEFLRNLDVLANEVLKCAKDTGHGAVVKLLLETGKADMTSNDYDGQTLLLWAAEKRHEAVVKLLLERGAQTECRDSKVSRTPLLWAAEKGHEAVVKLLLERGAQIEVADNNNRTPLSLAVEKGHEVVVKLLLERGAQIEGKSTDGYNQMPPLSWAAMNGHETVVKLLLEKGAQIKSKDNSSYRTPLSWAAMNGHEAVVKLLLEKGAQIEGENSGGTTPLWWATSWGHEAIVKLLLERGAQTESIDGSGRTPVAWAAEKGHEAIVKLLLESGAQIEIKDNGTCWTPLTLAVLRSHETVVKLLLEKGAQIESKDAIGRTPLSWAAEKGREAIVKLLLERGAQIKRKNRFGETPLSLASASLEQIKSGNRIGRTPLSFAAEKEKGHEAVVKLLREREAQIKSNRGFWALMSSAKTKK